MASKAERLRKVYEVKIGKKIVDKLSDKQIKILSAFYNSLSDKEQSDLDSQIIMGRNNTELHEMAIGMIEEEEENTEDKMPEGLDDLLNEISGNKKTATKPKRKRGRPKKKSSSPPPGALTKYSKTENVDSRILQLLGLEDVFDLDYDDYANLLKEKLIEVSKGTDDSSTEDAILLREELKKARGNKGKGAFKVKKKINKDSFTDFNVGQPKKDTAQARKPAYALLHGKQLKEKSQKVKDFKDEQSEEKKQRKQSDNQILKSISKSLDKIIGILSKQLEFDKKQTEKQRKLEERGKRKDKENKMESAFSKGIKSLAKVAGKIFSPLQDLFGRIVRFLTIIFLGKVVKKFIDWFTNPKNQSKVETLGRLLKTFWPAILAGLIFLNPLGRLITKAVFIIGKGVGKLLKVAIPSLLKFARRNPKLAAATALFTAGATIPMIFPGTVDEQERKTEKEVSEKGEDRTRKELERKANEPNFYERLTGQDSEAKEQLYKLDTGETKSYKRGGKITTESGKDIKGAGVDTQLIAARPGEIVINKETVNAVGADHFLGLNKQYGGANANKPKTVRGVQTASGGGLVLPAFSNGGMVGGEGPEESRIQPPRNSGIGMIASNSNKVRGSVVPKSMSSGQNNNVGEKSTQYNLDRNLSKMLSIYESGKKNEGYLNAYMDSENIPTIGHGATYYPPNFRLQGNVKMGDKITKEEVIEIKSFHVKEHRKRLFRELPEEVYTKLPDNVKAGLESMVFNYGSLSGAGLSPSLIINSHKNKDYAPIANHYRNVLAIHNKGVNAWRRNDEANLIEHGYSHRDGFPRINFNMDEGLDKYQKATKALGGDPSKPVPIPQITQGAIPKSKTNQQKLIEKRPWYDKLGLFGGASRLQKKEGGGMPITAPSKPKRWAMDPRGWFGMEGGGLIKENKGSGYIKENSGMNVFGSADRQKIIVQPGEYVLPVDTVMKMGGPGKLDRIVANTDSNSNPARMGLRNKDISEGITPYETQGSGGIDIETLPLSGLGGMGGSSGGLNSPNGTQDEFFSPISSAGLSERQRFMDTIGISAFG
jgi:GH24 family phage-related lysozyme (muramidase)